jgi:hypothetical protein
MQRRIALRIKGQPSEHGQKKSKDAEQGGQTSHPIPK